MSPAAPERAPFAARLAALRDGLARQEVDGFFLPRTDEHNSEYLPAGAERVAWLTGFTGSAAQVLVLPEAAAVFTDGRYTAQIAEEVDERLYERCHVVKTPVATWLESRAGTGLRLGYDPFLLKEGDRKRLEKALAAGNGTLVPLAINPVDQVWTDRPAPPVSQVSLLEDRWAGESSAEKRRRVGELVAAKGARRLLLTSADSVAWLLNVRGADIPFNPLCLSFVLLEQDGSCRWFVDPRKLPADLVLPNAVAVEPATALLPALDGLADGPVLVDPAETALGFIERLRGAGAVVIEADNPVVLEKARKNGTEIEGAVAAQRRDGAAVARFLAWLDRAPHDGSVSEVGAAEHLLGLRAEDPLFRGESFPAISAHGPNAALPHYRPLPASDRRLTDGTLYLIDSGGQYLDATTDITRTIVLGAATPEMRDRFTRVLKGHIAVADDALPARHHRGADRPFRPPRLVGGRARLRPRHRSRRRGVLVRARGSGADQQGRRCRGSGARHDPLQRARLLQGRALGHPDREPARRRVAGCGRGRRWRDPGLQEPHAVPDRPPSDRAGAPRTGRAGLDRRLPCHGPGGAVPPCRRRGRLARGRLRAALIRRRPYLAPRRAIVTRSGGEGRRRRPG